MLDELEKMYNDKEAIKRPMVSFANKSNIRGAAFTANSLGM